MLDFLKGAKKFSLYSGVIAMIMGVILLVFPSVTVNVICYIIGIALIAVGVVLVISFISNHSSVLSALAIVPGALAIVFGIVLCAKSEFFISIIQFLIGLFLVVKGIGDIFKSVSIKLLMPGWWLSAVTAVLVTIAGLLIIFNPFHSAVIITRLIGISFIVFSIIDISIYFRMKNAQSQSDKDDNVVYIQDDDK